jgi:hemerythrin-like domain-containing protein
MSKSIEVLTKDHKTLLRVANVLDSISGEAEEMQQFNSEDVEMMLRILRLFADDYLQAKEGGALFPVFSSVCDVSQFAALQQMLFEHDQDHFAHCQKFDMARSLLLQMLEELGKRQRRKPLDQIAVFLKRPRTSSLLSIEGGLWPHPPFHPILRTRLRSRALLMTTERPASRPLSKTC